MKTLLFITFIFTFSSAINAEEFKVHVQSFDEDLDVSEMESKDVSTISERAEVKSQINELPTPREMKEIFKDIGFGPEVTSMDQMDKDLFYLKVQQRPLSYLQKTYPDVSIAKIKRLKALISETK
jgi:hypothetical protein